MRKPETVPDSKQMRKPEPAQVPPAPRSEPAAPPKPASPPEPVAPAAAAAPKDEPAKETPAPDPGPSKHLELMALATEIERSPLPRRRREQLIEHLATIAGQVEEGELEWAEVEDAIVLVMKHPDIARRVVPLLASLLDEAA